MDLKELIGHLKKEIGEVNFRDVIMHTTGHKVLPANEKYLESVKKLKNFLLDSLEEMSINLKSHFKGRANEVSNFLERVLCNLLNQTEGFEADIPNLTTGKKQSAGYPDIMLKVDDSNFYLEVKTSQEKSKKSSFRAFYFKPSEISKVTKSYPHLLVMFEVESLGKNNKAPFKINGIKLFDLYDLKVQFKPEFNASVPMMFVCKEF